MRLAVCAASLAASTSASAQATRVIVYGYLVAPAEASKGGSAPTSGSPPTGGRVVALYTDSKRTPAGRLASGKTDADGLFLLTARVVGQRFLWVSDDLQSGWVGGSERVPEGEPDADDIVKIRVEPLRLKLADVRSPGGPRGAAEAVAAIGRNHQVKAWAGLESADAADAALADAVAHVDESMTDEQRAEFTRALEAAAAPLRAPSPDGLPRLANLQDDRFASDLVAMAPARRRWLPGLRGRPGEEYAYASRGARFEGTVAGLVGASDSLVSATEGALSIDPRATGSVELAWSDDRRRPVCLEAIPTDPRLHWRMRAVIPPGKSSFRWDLGVARGALVKRDALGVVARACGREDGPDGDVLPVRSPRTAGAVASYRLAFLSPASLYTVTARVSQGGGTGERTVELPPGSVKFDRNKATPVVTIEIPTHGLTRGAVRVHVEGEGPSEPFGPESVSLLHLPEG